MEPQISSKTSLRPSVPSRAFFRGKQVKHGPAASPVCVDSVCHRVSSCLHVIGIEIPAEHCIPWKDRAVGGPTGGGTLSLRDLLVCRVSFRSSSSPLATLLLIAQSSMKKHLWQSQEVKWMCLSVRRDPPSPSQQFTVGVFILLVQHCQTCLLLFKMSLYGSKNPKFFFITSCVLTILQAKQTLICFILWTGQNCLN